MLEKIGGLHFIDFKKLRENPVIVDAGAYEGKYIEILNGRIKRCRIIAFECDPDHVNTLKEKGFPNVTLCEKALIGHKEENLLIYHKYLGLPQSGSVGYEKQYVKKYARRYKGMMKYEVDSFGINDIFTEFGIDKIDYLKMNIEGMERDVLAMMTKETASKIGQISISIHAKILDDLNTSVFKGTADTDAFNRLNELGFKAENVDKRLTYGVREA